MALIYNVLNVASAFKEKHAEEHSRKDQLDRLFTGLCSEKRIERTLDYLHDSYLFPNILTNLEANTQISI